MSMFYCNGCDDLYCDDEDVGVLVGEDYYCKECAQMVYEVKKKVARDASSKEIIINTILVLFTGLAAIFFYIYGG